MNVVPYIDVMFVLLIIFMVTAPLVQQGVDIDLPVADSEPVDVAQSEPVIVEVNREGLYFLRMADEPDQSIPVSELMTRVAAIIKHRPQTQVLVRGDRNVSYGEVVRLMVVLKEAGVPKVGLMTQSPPDA
jgi:biopolymer transport protein TolR